MDKFQDFLERLDAALEDSYGGVVIVVGASREEADLVSRLKGGDFIAKKTDFVMWIGKDFLDDRGTPDWWWENINVFREGMQKHNSTFRDAFDATELTVPEVFAYTKREPVSTEAIYELLSF